MRTELIACKMKIARSTFITSLSSWVNHFKVYVSKPNSTTHFSKKKFTDISICLNVKSKYAIRYFLHLF